MNTISICIASPVFVDLFVLPVGYSIMGWKICVVILVGNTQQKISNVWGEKKRGGGEVYILSHMPFRDP